METAGAPLARLDFRHSHVKFAASVLNACFADS